MSTVERWYLLEKTGETGLTSLARWCSASWDVTGSAFGGNTPSDMPGTLMLVFMRINIPLGERDHKTGGNRLPTHLKPMLKQTVYVRSPVPRHLE